MNKMILHEDETYDPRYKWCPECGCNAYVVTYPSRLGLSYRCQCGLAGRFGCGWVSHPTFAQPGFEKEWEEDDRKE